MRIQIVLDQNPENIPQLRDIFVITLILTGHAWYAGTAAPTGGLIIQGNVGIGQAVPGTRLDVYDSTTAQGVNDVLRIKSKFNTYGQGSCLTTAIFDTNSSSDNNQTGRICGIFTDGGNGAIVNSALTFYTGLSGAMAEKMRIDKSGNVGIGTTAPGAKLTVNGTASTTNLTISGLGNTATNCLQITTQGVVQSAGAACGSGSGSDPFSHSATFGVTASATTSPIWLQSGADLYASSTIRIGSAGKTNLFFDSAVGNLGVGTSTPFAAVQIATTTGKNLVLSDTNAAANLKHWLLSVLGGNFSIGTTTDAYATSTTAAFTIDKNGLVGVGTSSPSGTLAVGGTLHVQGQCVTADTRLRRRRRRKNLRGLTSEGNVRPTRSNIESTYVYDECRIDEIEVGDEIQSLDETTGELVWSRVNRLMFMGVKQTYKITTEDGRTIRTTANHPYLVKDAKGKWLRHASPIANAVRLGSPQAGWATAANLKEGDEIAVTSYGDLRGGNRMGRGDARHPDGSRRTIWSLYSEHSSSISSKRFSKRSGSFWGTRSNTTPKTSPWHMYMKSWSFVTTARSSTSEAFAWIVSGAHFVASVKSNPRFDSRDLSSLRTFSSSKNRIGVDDDIVLLGDTARVIERSRNLRAREASHESVLNSFDRFSGGKQLENLPHHNAGAFERGLAVADFGISDDVFVQDDTLVHKGNSISNTPCTSSEEIGQGFTWSKIRSIEPIGEEEVFDVEIEGTHNFVAGHYIDERTGVALTPGQEEIVALRQNLELGTWSSDKMQKLAQLAAKYSVSTENAALADGAPVMSLKADCCKTDPDFANIANRVWMSSEDTRGVHKAAEGLEPSRHDLSGSILHRAAAYSGLYHARLMNEARRILAALAAKLQVPAEGEYAFGGLVAHNTYLGGNVGVGTSTPGSILSVQGAANFVASATSTIYNGLATPVINLTMRVPLKIE